MVHVKFHEGNFNFCSVFPPVLLFYFLCFCFYKFTNSDPQNDIAYSNNVFKLLKFNWSFSDQKVRPKKSSCRNWISEIQTLKFKIKKFKLEYLGYQGELSSLNGIN